MPLVRIEMIAGKSREYKKCILDCVHTALMEAIGIEDEDRFQRLIEIPREYFETAPGKTDGFMIIEITMFRGRTAAQKRKLIETLTQTLAERLGILATDVFIVMHEPPDENWGLGGRQRGAQ